MAVISAPVQARLELSAIFSDGMVIQRDEIIKVWGISIPEEEISVAFQGFVYKSHANKEGYWRIYLPAQKAGTGHSMTISTTDSRVVLSDIAFGDVWVASGQSNMQFTMRQVSKTFPEEFTANSYPDVRQFYVKNDYNFKGPVTRIDSGKWKHANQQTLGRFSAVAWFFAKEIYEVTGVPIGIYSSSIGGTPIEAWMSIDSLKNFPDFQAVANHYKDDENVKKVLQENSDNLKAWQERLKKSDRGLMDDNHWYSTDLDDSYWSTIVQPGDWNSKINGFTHGVVWLRKEFVLNQNDLTAARLKLGNIKDADVTYVNGVKVGQTGNRYQPRVYDVPESVLNRGVNVVAVRVEVRKGWGGFIKDKTYQLETTSRTVSLSGEWKYQVGATIEKPKAPIVIPQQPTGLFNAMIAPLTKNAIKGVIWYQGESNTSRPEIYAKQFSSMISDWRLKWQQPELPFLFVQLANFMKPDKLPVESSWANLREAQAEVDQSVANTGMALAIDVGEWNDIHPQDKKTVGKRLALAARNIAYDDDVEYQGPTYASMKRKGSQLIIELSHVESGLQVKGNQLHEFAIAGADKKYVWANARVEGNTIVVWHDDVPLPVHVRYAWSHNPDKANLYNGAGLPAVPFSKSYRESLNE